MVHMNITVLVKPVPYKSIVSDDGNVVRNKIKNIISKNDKCAIETALRIKDKLDARVSSISMTVKSNMSVVKEILAYGTNDAILLCDNVFAGSDTNATAYILSKAIEKNKSDLIICGKVSSDSGTSQVGISVAAKLNIPFLYDVCEIIDINKKKIICKVINDNSYQIIESNIPCVLIVNDSINIPRIPTVNDRLLSMQRDITIWNSDDILVDKGKCGFNGSVTSVIKITPLNMYKNTNIIEGNINDKINKLLGITKDNFNNKLEVYNYEIKKNNSNFEYWIYDNNFNYTCKLIARCYELSKKTGAKIVVISFNNNDEYFKYGANKLININIKNSSYMTKILVLEKLLNERRPDIFLFSKTSEGKILSSYLASKLNLGLSADCVKLELDENNRLVQIRSAYGGRMLANIISKNSFTQMATVLPNNNKLIYNEDNDGDIENIDSNIIYNCINILKEDSINDKYLNKDIIIACGMGAIRELDNLKKIANLIGASIGITRDVYDKGDLDSNYLIGQSGSITNSKIYIAFGISGAIEHTIGINSDILISINNDTNAPIIKISDYYINEDVNEFIPLLLDKLEEINNE